MLEKAYASWIFRRVLNHGYPLGIQHLPFPFGSMVMSLKFVSHYWILSFFPIGDSSLAIGTRHKALTGSVSFFFP